MSIYNLVKSIVYKVYLRILQVPGISVNSHVAVIFLVFLNGIKVAVHSFAGMALGKKLNIKG